MKLAPNKPIPDKEISIKGEVLVDAEKALTEKLLEGDNDRHGRFVLAALSSIPWVGFLGAIANLKGETDQDDINLFVRLWLQEHKDKIKELMTTINEILIRLDGFGEDVQKRIESPEYLNLVRKTFRAWDQTDTVEKRFMLKKLLENAGAINLCPDDQIRLFIDWVEKYHESHFAVMREIYLNQRITKGQIWDNLHPEGRPLDNSAQAGFFSYLMRELNLGGIIHLERTSNAYGQNIKKTHHSSSTLSKSETHESPFENTKHWVLSELGKEFVRYVMEDVDLQLETSN